MENTQTQTPVSAQSHNPDNILNNADHRKTGYPRMAGFFERYAALLIDGFILTTGWIILSIFSTVAFGQENVMAELFVMIVSIVAPFVYFGWFYVNKGQSVGKMVLRLKVVRREDLNYISWGPALGRELMARVVSSVLFYLGYLWYFMSPRRQTWHDSVSDTYVVKTDAAGKILMDGPAEYEKEPVKTFGILAVMIAMFIAAIIAVSMLISMLWESGEFKEFFESADYYTEMEDFENFENFENFDFELEDDSMFFDEEDFNDTSVPTQRL